LLNKIYDHQIKEVFGSLKALHLDKSHQMSVAEYIHRHSRPNNRLELLKKMLTFDSCLLDIKLAHSVVQAQDKQKVIAIAGGAHITRVAQMLIKDGYSQLMTTNIVFDRENDVQKCLGSHVIDGAFCIKPAPIDLMLFERALKLK
jgi:hypothetical protein